MIAGFVSCKKESAQSCERWNVREDYQEQTNGHILNSSYVTISVCGDDLTAAHSGKQTRKPAGSGVIEITTYLQKVN